MLTFVSNHNFYTLSTAQNCNAITRSGYTGIKQIPMWLVPLK